LATIRAKKQGAKLFPDKVMTILRYLGENRKCIYGFFQANPTDIFSVGFKVPK
jgi:hypothetical protein